MSLQVIAMCDLMLAPRGPGTRACVPSSPFASSTFQLRSWEAVAERKNVDIMTNVFLVESGTLEEQVILLEVTVERLAPQRLVVLSHGVKGESLPS